MSKWYLWWRCHCPLQGKNPLCHILKPTQAWIQTPCVFCWQSDFWWWINSQSATIPTGKSPKGHRISWPKDQWGGIELYTRWNRKPGGCALRSSLPVPHESQPRSGNILLWGFGTGSNPTFHGRNSTAPSSPILANISTGDKWLPPKVAHSSEGRLYCFLSSIYNYCTISRGREESSVWAAWSKQDAKSFHGFLVLMTINNKWILQYSIQWKDSQACNFLHPMLMDHWLCEKWGRIKVKEVKEQCLRPK